MPKLIVTKKPPAGGQLTIELAGPGSVEKIAPPPERDVPVNISLMIAWIASGSPGDKFSIILEAQPGFKLVMENNKKNPIERKIAPNLFVHTGSVKFHLEAGV
jgi:hypothetical protein